MFVYIVSAKREFVEFIISSTNHVYDNVSHDYNLTNYGQHDFICSFDNHVEDGEFNCTHLFLTTHNVNKIAIQGDVKSVLFRLYLG